MFRLYLRLFVAICAVSTAVLLVNIVVAKRIDASAAQAVPDLQAIAAEVAQAWRDGGPPALDNLHAAQRADHFDLYLLRDGRPVVPRPLPPPLHDSLPQLIGPEAATRTLGMGELVFAVPVNVEPDARWHVVGFRPPGQEPHADLRLLLGVQIAICVIAVALLSWMLWRGLTGPLLSVQATVRRLAGGALDARVGTHLSDRGDEIGLLAQDVDHMAGQIQLLVENRQRLLHDVSHELRAPLARLRLALELERMDHAQQPASKHLAQADREIDRLDAMIDEVLTLSRLDHGTQPDAQRLSVTQLLDECAELARPEADAKQIRFEVSAAPQLHAQGDPALLRRAVGNLLRNAIRFSPAGGVIRLTAMAAAMNLEIRIADSGPGAAAQDLPQLFEPFYRGRSSGGAGYGLGLAIVARIMAAHGGSVEARNLASGGLEVCCRLPAG